MSENKREGKNFLIGAVVGGVLGAFTALLLAPKSGRELREEIKEQVHHVAGKTQDLAKNIGSQTSDWIGKAKEVAGSVTKDILSMKEAQKDMAADEELPVKTLAEANLN